MFDNLYIILLSVCEMVLLPGKGTVYYIHIVYIYKKESKTNTVTDLFGVAVRHPKFSRVSVSVWQLCFLYAVDANGGIVECISCTSGQVLCHGRRYQ